MRQVMWSGWINSPGYSRQNIDLAEECHQGGPVNDGITLDSAAVSTVSEPFYLGDYGQRRLPIKSVVKRQSSRNRLENGHYHNCGGVDIAQQRGQF